MDITKIPFIEKAGIKQDSEGRLLLKFDKSVQNHVQTIHASALFTLAESASGAALLSTFPELEDKVVPLVRDSQLKFKQIALTDVVAYPSIPEDAVKKFREQFSKKGRSTLIVKVDIKDNENSLICTGTFKWFIQSIKNRPS